MAIIHTWHKTIQITLSATTLVQISNGCNCSAGLSGQDPILHFVVEWLELAMKPMCDNANTGVRLCTICVCNCQRVAVQVASSMSVINLKLNQTKNKEHRSIAR